MIFLRIFGLVFLAYSWFAILDPKSRTVYKRSRVPVSRRSKIVSAVGATAFCLALFGIQSLLCAGLAYACVAVRLLFWKLDSRDYEKQTGRWPDIPTDPQQTRVMAQALDLVFLSLFLCALIRDHFSPPVTADQKILHCLALGVVIVTSIFAAVLFLNRPGSQTREK
jgi:hypothetical protein